MENFTIGDVVTLKSGGPLMTITYISEKKEADCAWFNAAGEVSRNSFNVDTLKMPSATKAKVRIY